MADPSTQQMLRNMFPTVEPTIINQVLLTNNNNVDAAIDELLTIQSNLLAASVNPAAVPPVVPVVVPPARQPQQPAPQVGPAAGGDDKRHIQNLGTIFGDLSVSVITTVFNQNHGDLQGTVDTLINIQADQDAIAQIRQLNREQQQKYEQQMQAERDRQIKERERLIAQQVEEQKRRLDSLVRVKEEELRRREQERAERERLKQQLDEAEKKKRLQAEQEAHEAARRAAVEQQKLVHERAEAARHAAEAAAMAAQASAEKQRAAEAEAAAAAAAALAAAEKQRLADVEAAAIAERETRRREMESMAKKMAELDERLREQERELVDKDDEIQRNQQILKQREDENEKLRKEAEICTLAVQYSQKQKEVIVVYALQKQKPNKSDWVGFYRVGDSNKQYLKYIATNGNQMGHEMFDTPKVPGLYEFRFFLAGAYEDVARSDAIFIGPQLEMQSELLEAEGKIRLTWNLKSGELSSKDWVGFYRKDKTNKNYISSHYLSKAANGSIEVPAPRRPDDYEFRFLPYACGYQHITTSNVITVPNKDRLNTEEVLKDGVLHSLRVTWNVASEDISNWDWIALYKVGAANSYYESYQYVDSKAGHITYEVPRTPGRYELRYHSKAQRRSRHIAVSPVFEVIDRDAVTAKFDGGYIKVEWSIHSVDVSSSDWVGIYKIGESNNKSYVDYKYLDTKQGFLLFDRPDSGAYEARFFSASKPKYEALKHSARVDIP